MLNSKTILLTGADSSDLIEFLESHFELYSEQHENVIEYRYFDTFDWLLYEKDLTFVKIGDSVQLLDYRNAYVISEAKWRRKNGPKFAHDFANSDFRRTLEHIIDVRALLELATIKKKERTFRILDQEQKTTVIFVINNYLCLKGKTYENLISTMEIIPIRGYDNELNNFIKMMKQKIGFLKATNKLIFEQALHAYGKVPHHYSSKLNIHLQATMSSAEAAKLIIHRLLEIAKQNERGVYENIDSEFLHDYRVAIRKIRSALNQIKFVFDKQVTDECKRDFKKIGKMTNQCRDLDVYVEKRCNYTSMLPSFLKPGLTVFFSNLQKKRKRSYSTLQSAFDSKEYKGIMERWTSFFAETNQLEKLGKSGAQPIIDLAKNSIYKKFRKVITEGEKIHDETPDEYLHELRIHCKQLRYLMEFFSSLFPQDDISFLIKQLKVLQTNLGDFNDLCVQILFLKNKIEQQTMRNNSVYISAIGALIGTLYHQKKLTRKKFHEKFNYFSSDETVNLFSNLFK